MNTETQAQQVLGPANGIPETKRQRVVEVPDATQLDYTEVPPDAENGAFNSDFYLIKMTVDGVTYYVKKSEVPVLQTVAQEKKYFMKIQNGKKVDFIRVQDGVFRHTKSLAVAWHAGEQLWVGVTSANMDGVTNEHLDACFYLNVKYPELELRPREVKDFFHAEDEHNEERDFERKWIPRGVEDLQMEKTQLAILLKSIEDKTQLLKSTEEKVYLPAIIARIAYERGLMPEDPAVIEAAKQEYAGQ